jgi:hypothetical protein
LKGLNLQRGGSKRRPLSQECRKYTDFGRNVKDFRPKRAYKHKDPAVFTPQGFVFHLSSPGNPAKNGACAPLLIVFTQDLMPASYACFQSAGKTILFLFP